MPLAIEEYEKYDSARRKIEAADIDELSDSVKRIGGKK